MVENTGSLTLAEDSQSITFNHGLPSAPTIVIAWTEDPTGGDGSNSPVSFRSIVANFIVLKQSDAVAYVAHVYSSAGSGANLTGTNSSFAIDSTSVTLTSNSTGYKFKAGKEYKWRAIV